MVLHILLRFAINDPEDSTKNTIDEHLKVLKEKGYVWWGKFGRGIADSKYKLIKDQLSKSISTYAYLYQGAAPKYKANIVDIHKKDGGARTTTKCPEPDLVPSYYQDKEEGVWFKFNNLDPLNSTYDINLDYELQNGERISLAGQSAIFFIKPKDENSLEVTQKQPYKESVPEDPIIDLLLQKKQVILYGPPGTGKTYNTKIFAVKII